MARCKGICKTGFRCKKQSTSGFCHIHSTLECGICFEPINKNQSKILGCGHSYCKKCINTWILQQNLVSTCPMCRANVSDIFVDEACKYGLITGVIKYVPVYIHNVNLLDEFDSLLALVIIPERYYSILLTQEIFSSIVNALSDTARDKLSTTGSRNTVLVKSEIVYCGSYHMITN